MFRNTVIIIIGALILSACSGGISGVMTSSGFGYWQIYKVNYDPVMASKIDQATEELLEEIFFNLGFDKKYDWGKPFLTNALVATFKRMYRDRYIVFDVQISEDNIIFMSLSYSEYTQEVFNKLESTLNEVFGEANIEKCLGRKDLNGHSCFQN